MGINISHLREKVVVCPATIKEAIITVPLLAFKPEKYAFPVFSFLVFSSCRAIWVPLPLQPKKNNLNPTARPCYIHPASACAEVSLTAADDDRNRYHSLHLIPWPNFPFCRSPLRHVLEVGQFGRKAATTSLCYCAAYTVGLSASLSASPSHGRVIHTSSFGQHGTY